MNSHDELERRLRGWMVDAAPSREPVGLVGRTMAGAARVQQRPGILVDTGFGRRWLTLPRLSPAIRLALVALLALAAVAAAALAGALPVPDEPPPARNGLIAYEISDLADQAYHSIRLMDPDGTADRAFTTGASPVFSGDGRYLAYSTATRFRPDLELLVVAADRSTRHSVPGYMLMGFALSPDGSQVAMRRVDDGNVLREYVLVSVAGGGRRTLVVEPSDPELSYTNLVWSPDGRSIAFTVMRRDETATEYAVGIDVIDVTTGQVRRVSSRLGEGVSKVSWSPDGRSLAFSAWPDGTPTPHGDEFGGYQAPPGDVFVAGIDGTGDRNLTDSAGVRDEQPAWSPDGSSIAWLTTGDPGYRVAVRRVRDLATFGAPALGPPADQFTWSPDGAALLVIGNDPMTPGGDVLRGTIQLIDVRVAPELALGAPRTLIDAEHAVNSPTWQRLVP